ncbi:MAG: bifunctional DNA primase/polymerase [Geodermatophilaceae bacterium]|nr:bifunctional DNA primase/polymerase [Geodermatophilaceae bacterium]
MSRVLEGETDGERSVSEAAHAFLAAGFSVLPVKQDGTKAPAVQKWKKLQTASAKAEQIEGWFSDGRRTGLGLVTGYGSLECLEFESADAWRLSRES